MYFNVKLCNELELQPEYSIIILICDSNFRRLEIQWSLSSLLFATVVYYLQCFVLQIYWVRKTADHSCWILTIQLFHSYDFSFQIFVQRSKIFTHFDSWNYFYYNCWQTVLEFVRKNWIFGNYHLYWFFVSLNQARIHSKIECPF